MDKAVDRTLGDRVDPLPINRSPDMRRLFGLSVTLMPFDPGRHGSALFSAAKLDESDAIWTYLPYGPFAQASELAQTYQTLAAPGDPKFYAIQPKSSGRIEGVASYLRITPVHGSIEIGHICFTPPLQRTRAATEALFLMMKHAFDDLAYRRLEWKCNALNAASCRAAERLGFTFEGVFRQHLVVKGRNRDSAWFSIIDQEWPAIKARFNRWMSPDNFDADGVQRRGLEKI